MAQYTLKINEFVFLVTPEVFPKIVYNWKRSGHQIAATEMWPLRCWFVRDSINALRADWDAFLALIENGGPLDVKFLLDGSPVDEILSSIHNDTTPRFENIQTISMGGGFVNHIEFTMDVVGERPIRFDGILDVDETDEEEEGPDGVVRRIRIKAVGKNARTFVLARLSAKGGVPIKIVRRTEEFENSFEVTAEIHRDSRDERPQGPGVDRDDEGKPFSSISERVSISRPRRPIRSYGRTVGNGIAPYLIKGAVPATEVTVDGHIETKVFGDGSQPPDRAGIALVLSEDFIRPVSTAALALGLEPYIDKFDISVPYPVERGSRNVPYVFGVDYSWHAMIDIDFTNSDWGDGLTRG
jgi:hypothetical protein